MHSPLNTNRDFITFLSRWFFSGSGFDLQLLHLSPNFIISRRISDLLARLSKPGWFCRLICTPNCHICCLESGNTWMTPPFIGTVPFNLLTDACFPFVSQLNVKLVKKIKWQTVPISMQRLCKGGIFLQVYMKLGVGEMNSWTYSRWCIYSCFC